MADENKKNPYSIREIFQQMELDLIASLKRNFFRHKNEELKEGFQWEQWQLVKLRNLVKFRKANKAIIGEYSQPIENAINEALQESFKTGQENVEKAVEKAQEAVGEIALPEDIKPPSDVRKPQEEKTNSPGKEIKPVKGKSSSPEEMESLKNIIEKAMEKLQLPKAAPEENFFGANEKKLNALQKSVTNDLKEANNAILRKMDDVYRQVIYKAEMNMAAGAKTLNQAIDMATKEFLNKGINCIEYKDGKRVNIASYAEMALRTASQRATFLGEGKKRDEWGIQTVVVSAHATTCGLCAPWQAKILIDDVFSSGSKADGDHSLLSEAMKAGLLHPNCRHTLATYFPGITKIPEMPDEETAKKYYEAEQEQRRIERQIRRWKRIEAGSVDAENANKASDKVKELQDRLKEHLGKSPQLRRDYNREKPGSGISNKDVKDNSKLLKQQAGDAKIEEAKNKILNGEYNLKVKREKQKEHILGLKQWKDYFKRKVDSGSNSRPTMFNKDVNVQELINEYTGKGIVDFAKKGDMFPREYIDTDKIIGKYWDDIEMRYKDANRFVIIYSSKGTHAFPVRPLKKGE